MNGSGILRPGERLKGARVAHVALRPVRLGFLVPDDDPAIAVRVIESCCLTWGGYLNSIIPYSRSHGLTTGWGQILELLDPDDLVDCVGISEADQKGFSRYGRHIHKWDDTENTFFTVGALQYSGLKAFGEHLKSARHIVVNPVMPSTDTLFLPLISRRGRLNESFLEETLRSHQWSATVKYDQFVPVEDVPFSGVGADILLGDHPNSFPYDRYGSGITHLRDPIRLTLLGITQHGPSYSIGGEDPESPQHDEGYESCIVITGEAGSVADLALYWDLRIERISSDPFPLWIPLDILDSQEGKQIVDAALSRLGPALKEGPGRSSTLYILSSSTTMSTLETRLIDRFPDSSLRTENFPHFLTGKCKFDFDLAQREVYFDEGRARVPLPRPSALENFAPWDRVTHDVEIEQVKLPSTEALHAFRFERITRSGTLENFARVDAWPPFVYINIPDGWTTLTSMLDDAGYECVPSDKGRLTLGQLALFGEIEDVGIVASRKVHGLLRDLSQSRGKEDAQRRLFFADRPTTQFSQLSNALGREVAPALVKSLVDKGVLLRGTRIRCPRCQLDIWYEVDRVARNWRCDGCQVSLPIPLSPDVTQWSYRVNELYAVGHDQGTITHLLALYNLFPPTLLGNASILGYYPGVVLKAKVGSVTPIESLEIDLIGIRDGKLILVECKDSGGTLQEEEAFKLADVADHLNCSRLIFVTPTEFAYAESFWAKVQSRCQARVEAWEGRDIFDQRTSERMGGQRDNQSDEVRARSYLERLTTHLTAE